MSQVETPRRIRRTRCGLNGTNATLCVLIDFFPDGLLAGEWRANSGTFMRTANHVLKRIGICQSREDSSAQSPQMQLISSCGVTNW